MFKRYSIRGKNNMKIVSTKLTSLYHSISRAASIFDYLEWDYKKYPITDMLEDHKPDILFIGSSQLSKHMISVINEYPSLKVISFGRGIPEKFNPHITVCDTLAPDVVIKNMQCIAPVLQVDYSANTIDIFDYSTPDYPYQHNDIGYICSIKNTEDYVEKLKYLSILTSKYNVRIVGDRICLPEYLGTIKDKELPHFFRSSKIIIDQPFRYYYDILANGGLPINDPKLVEFTLDSNKSNTKVNLKRQRELRKNTLENHTGLCDLKKTFKLMHGMEDAVNVINQKIKDQLCVVE